MVKTKNQSYNVGIYCRLSKDDGTDLESASIGTQKSILTDYVKQQGWHLVKTYVDDGYSGTNFERPNFQAMIKDIEGGLIDCVITKDLSLSAKSVRLTWSNAKAGLNGRATKMRK